MKKLHLGCGKVYLKGFINIDYPSLKGAVKLASLASFIQDDFRNKYGVDVENYYSKSNINGTSRQIVCDGFDNAVNLDKRYSTIDINEIVVFHLLEHFPEDVAEKAITYWINLLKKGGILRLMVPEIELICMRLAKALTKTVNPKYHNPEHLYRLIYGSHNNGYNLDGHKSAWDVVILKRIFEKNNMTFKIEKPITDQDFNPSLYVSGVKQ